MTQADWFDYDQGDAARPDLENMFVRTLRSEAGEAAAALVARQRGWLGAPALDNGAGFTSAEVEAHILGKRFEGDREGEHTVDIDLRSTFEIAMQITYPERRVVTFRVVPSDGATKTSALFVAGEDPHEMSKEVFDQIQALADRAAEVVHSSVREARVAVLVVHGIGEQRPLATITSLVRSLVGTDPLPDGRRPYAVSHDGIARDLDLNQIRVWPNSGRPEVQFYEFYWAHKISKTTFLQVLQWLVGLLARLGRRMAPQTRVVWLAGVLLVPIVLAVATAMTLGVAALLAAYTDGIARAMAIVALIVGALSVVALISNVSSGVGDAARYLGDRPANVALRASIRSAGVDILTRLHESERYDRIVVVGHSLGSMIAYDMLSSYWRLVNRASFDDIELSHAMLSKAESYFPSELAEGDLCVASFGSAETMLELRSALGQGSEWVDWHEHQSAVLSEAQDNGLPWLVSDLITLGSPLTHASLLMADGPADLLERQLDRELPANPPIPEVDAGDGTKPPATVLHYERPLPKGEGKYRVPLASAPFVATRWTNIYYGNYRILGDPVGGPVREQFGQGIWDIAAETPRLSSRFGLVRRLPAIGLAHTRYWKPGTDGLTHLVDALDLDAPLENIHRRRQRQQAQLERWLRPRVKP